MSESINDIALKHSFILDVLKATNKKSEKRPIQEFGNKGFKLYIGHLYGRIKSINDVEHIQFTLDDIDDLVRAYLYIIILHNKNVFVALNDIYSHTCDILNNVVKETFPISSTFDFNSPMKHLDIDTIKNILDVINNTLVSNATLLMLCPQYFNLTDIISENEIKRSYLNISDDKTRSNTFIDFIGLSHNNSFLQKILSNMWDSDESLSKSEFSNIINEIRIRMSLKTFGSMDFNELVIINELLSFKPLSECFLNNIIYIELESQLYNSCGIKREILSILGRFFTRTALNEELIEVSKYIGLNKSFYENVKCTRLSEFYGVKDLNRLKMSISSKRNESDVVINILLQIFKNIFKADQSSRNTCLVIIGRIISCNVTRRKVLRLTNIDSPPLTLEPLYYTRMSLSRDNTFGFCINLVWLLLLLAQGITTSKVSDIDPFYCQTSNIVKQEIKLLETKSDERDSEFVANRTSVLSTIENDITSILGFLVNSPSCMGDENEVNDVLAKFKIDPIHLFNAKFITQIFWLTLHGVIMLFLPALQENLKILSHTLNYANSTPNLDINDEKLANYISHVYTWRSALQHPTLIKALWHFINISLRLFLRCSLLYNVDGDINHDYNNILNENKGRYGVLVDQYFDHVYDSTQNISQSPQLTVLPVDFIECILDVIKNMSILRQYDAYIKPVDKGLLDGMDFEIIVTLCIFLMKSPNNIIKNVHIKCDMACATILYLCKCSEDGIAKFENIELAKTHLMDALCRTFISSQKTTYNARVSSRLNIIQCLSLFFVIPAYKNSFVSSIISKRDIFVQFMHLLLNDTTFLIEEVVSYLSEIRRRELAGISLDDQPSDEQSSNSRNDEENNDDTIYTQDGAIDANQLKSMRGSELKGRTRTFVEYGYEICSLLCILCNEFPGEITNNSVLLPQVSTCLGCCIESLAGQKCLQLKVKNMQEYGFKPKEWLSKIMQCYISLYLFNEDDETPFIKAVVHDERYYKPETFNRCIRFATREMFLNYKSIKSFNSLSNKLFEYAKRISMIYDNAINEDVPETYLDPIMMDIMEDPVLLPGSGKIMDRKNIERHLMSESTDPFTRAPLSREELIDQPELKAEIDAFIKSLSNKRT